MKETRFYLFGDIKRVSEKEQPAGLLVRAPLTQRPVRHLQTQPEQAPDTL